MNIVALKKKYIENLRKVADFMEENEELHFNSSSSVTITNDAPNHTICDAGTNWCGIRINMEWNESSEKYAE